MTPTDNIDEWRAALLNALTEDVEGEELFAETARAARKTEELVEVLAFRLGGETFGFNIAAVSEILRPRPITALPRCPDFILGVLSLRGRVLPVTDTSRRLGLGSFAFPSSHRFIVVRDGEDLMGFAVDAVVGVVRFPKAEMENTQYAASIDPSFLIGIGYDQKRQLVALLNGEKLCDFTLERK